jgi:UDP-N-acetylglucosamine 1-carboxyvinyltransferase
MRAYKIRGGKPIQGEITALGAKNFVTKAMIAALLTKDKTTFTNVPAIGDTQITYDMLMGIGVGAAYDKEKGEMMIAPDSLTSSAITLPDSGANRMPILLLSALMNRFDKVSVPVLGGCKIGERKVDFHINAIKAFGGEVIENQFGYIASKSGRLKGTQIELPFPSVGATETFLYLSVLAEGTSVLKNAAVEPEIFELITMLRSMGAIIFTNVRKEFIVEGVKSLKGTNMKVLGDRIEVASWASLACVTNGSIVVHGIRPSTLGNFLSYFRKVGGGFDLVGPESIKFYRENPLTPALIETDVYPGFSTDWQQPFASILTQANGVSVIHETVYERRLGYLKALEQLGAKVQTSTQCLGSAPCRFKDANHEHSAIIIGPTKLISNNFTIQIPDLRAGLAYVIAAAAAEGTTTLTGIENIERGYGDIIPRLTKMNLDIEMTEV